MTPSRFPSALFASVAFITLASCGGGGGSTPPASSGGPPPVSSTPTPAPTATPTPPPVGTSSRIVNAEENFQNPDSASWYTSGTASWSNHAGVTASGNNGDGDTCDTSMTSEPTGSYFHSHAFVGIYYNGNEVALPQAIGIESPIEPTKGTPAHQYDYDEVENASCMFHVHTHDYSGLVHIEVPEAPFDSTYQTLPSYANLQTLLDIWGATLSSGAGLTAGSNTLSGPVTIYTGASTAKDSGGNDLVTTYAPAAGAPATIPLAHHEAIWIVIGAPPANGLPQVDFVIAN